METQNLFQAIEQKEDEIALISAFEALRTNETSRVQEAVETILHIATEYTDKKAVEKLKQNAKHAYLAPIGRSGQADFGDFDTYQAYGLYLEQGKDIYVPALLNAIRSKAIQLIHKPR